MLLEAKAVYEAVGIGSVATYSPRQPDAAAGQVRAGPGACCAAASTGLAAVCWAKVLLRLQRQLLHCQRQLHTPHSLNPPLQVIYELRNYQLHPGYGSVPKLLEAFARGCGAAPGAASCRCCMHVADDSRPRLPPWPVRPHNRRCPCPAWAHGQLRRHPAACPPRWPPTARGSWRCSATQTCAAAAP